VKRDWIDAEFEVVRETAPRTWDPFRGLGPLGKLLAAAVTLAVLVALREVIYPPISGAVDWLFALSRH
jgi:hypothetical protein